MAADDCSCEPDYPPDPDDPEQESIHFTRTCRLCGFVWGSNHCPHDGVQRSCPECSWIDPEKRTPMQLLGLES